MSQQSVLLAPIPPEIRKQAATWLVELQSDEASDQTCQDWQAWRASHADHERAWQRIEAMGAKLQTLQLDLAQASLAPRGSSRRRAIRGLGIALFAGGLAWVAEERTPWHQWAADRRTGVGERATVTLPDGSRIELNTSTAVDIDFTDTERVVRLVAGEILVTTAPESLTPARPFFVQTGEGRLQALGTRFSVRQIERGQSGVAVYGGAVKVSPRHGGSLVLHPGQQTSFTSSLLDQPEAADEAHTAWVQGMIVAQDMPLGEFIAELARHRPGWLGCASAVADLKVTGTYPVNDTTKVLGMLALALPVEITYRTRLWAKVQPRGRVE